MGRKGTPKYSNEFKFDAVRLVVEEGLTQAEVARRLGTSELRRLKQLEEENFQLKKIVADLTLDKQMLQEVLKKKL